MEELLTSDTVDKVVSVTRDKAEEAITAHLKKRPTGYRVMVEGALFNGADFAAVYLDENGICHVEVKQYDEPITIHNTDDLTITDISFILSVVEQMI
jgi:hypothetical protein